MQAFNCSLFSVRIDISDAITDSHDLALVDSFVQMLGQLIPDDIGPYVRGLAVIDGKEIFISFDSAAIRVAFIAWANDPGETLQHAVAMGKRLVERERERAQREENDLPF